MPENPTARDGKPGCPVTVWDGPYSTRCGAGASVGKCAHHGPFATTAPEASVAEPKPAELPITPDHEALSDILVAHQRIPTFDGSLSSKRCSGLGCDSMKGQSDGPNSPRHAWHLADLIIAEGWVSAETLKAREAAARREAEDDPAHARMYRALVERAERAEAEVATARRDGEMRSAALWYAERTKVERVEALATGLQEQYEASDYSETASLGEIVKAIRAALAEPERDEEGGR